MPLPGVNELVEDDLPDLAFTMQCGIDKNRPAKRKGDNVFIHFIDFHFPIFNEFGPAQQVPEGMPLYEEAGQEKKGA